MVSKISEEPEYNLSEVQRTGSEPESVSLASATEWTGFVSNLSQPVFYYRPGWGKLLNDLFGHTAYCLCTRESFKGESIVTGILPMVHIKSLMFGSMLISLPFCNWGGALTNKAAYAEKLLKGARQLASRMGVKNLQIRSDRLINCGLAAKTHKVRMVLELPDSRAGFQASLPAKVRSQARRPLREGAIFRCGSVELVEQFYTVFSRNMRDLGTPVLPKDLFRELVKRFASEIRIVLVEKSSKAVAAGLLIRNGERMEIPWAASLREANRFGVNMLLYSEAIAYSIEHGCKKFDFGRSTKDSGTYKFKKQWGAEPEQLYWYEWVGDKASAGPGLSPDNPRYGLAIRTWQKLPVWLANTLGPHVASKLP